MPKTIAELEAEIAKMKAAAEASDDSSNDGNTEGEENDDDEAAIQAALEAKKAKEAAAAANDGDDKDTLTDREKALKESLNALDKKYKDTLKAQKALEKAARDAEIEALQKDGKTLEAANKRQEDLEAELAVLRDENVALRRDSVLDSALVGVEFKNERSRKIARKDIVEQLVKTEDGTWKTKDGKDIAEFTTEYFDDDENRSLFLKARTNTGAGTNLGDKNNGGAPKDEKSNNIFDMSQDQMIKKVRKSLGR